MDQPSFFFNFTVFRATFSKFYKELLHSGKFLYPDIKYSVLVAWLLPRFIITQIHVDNDLAW